MYIAVGDGAGFSMMDGTAMEHARRFDGSYSMVFMARMVAGAFAPAIGGLLIKDAHDGSKQWQLVCHNIFVRWMS